MKLSIWIKFLTTLILLTRINNTCTRGCVQCKEEKCQVCSPSFTLNLAQNACIDEEVPECRTYKSSGGCYLCNANHYFDSEQKLCVLLEAGQMMPKCKFYDTIEGNAGSGVNVVCLECDSSSYLVNGACEAVGDVVEHCEGYDGNAKCDACKKNFILNGNFCEEISVKGNCVSYSNVQCLACKENFSIVDNFLEKKLRVLGSYGSYLEKFDIMDYYNRQIVEIEEKCSNFVIDNCLVAGSYNNCRACNPGYWLDNGICVENPIDLVKNCLRYESKTSCSECVQGFFLKSSSECSANLDITHCEEYSGVQNHTRCTKCNLDYFIADDNVCFLRTNKIDNCLTFNNFNDTCTKCFDDYSLSDDGIVCQAVVENCQKYYDTNDSVCEICNNGYYLNTSDNICVKGETLNCDRFKRTENVCELCLNKFFIDNSNQCVSQSDIAECKLYDRILPGKCNECTFKTVLFKKTTECIFITLEGCEIFSAIDKCKRCLDNFTLTTDNLCVALEPNSKCLRDEYDECTQCKPGYILEQGVCLDPFGYMAVNCASDSNDDLTGLTKPLNSFCSKCNTDSVALNYNGRYLCVLDTRLEELMGEAPDSSCRAYRLNENKVYQCDLCEPGKIVSEDNKSCILEVDCTSEKSIYLATLSIQDDKINISNTELCGTQRDNCRRFGPKLMQKDLPKKVNYGCVECIADYHAIVNFENNPELNNTTLYSFPESNNLFSVTKDLSNLFGIPDIKCLDKTSLNYLAKTVNTNAIDNCNYYILLPDGHYGCAQCKLTHKGKTINFFIDKCMEYDFENETCKQCDWGNALTLDLLSQENMACITGTPPSDCDDKSFNTTKCYGCDSTHYLDISTTPLLPTCTILSTITECQIYSHKKDICIKCNDDFHLKADSTDCITDIPFCLKYIDPAGTLCEKCQDTKHPNLAKTQCISGNSKCQIFDQIPGENATEVCLKYTRYIPFEMYGVCESTETGNITNCKKFSAVDVCEECDSTYYLYKNKCCGYGFYGNNCDVDATVINCEIFDLHPDQITNVGKFICTQCKDGYHIDVNRGGGLNDFVGTTVVDSTMICSQDGSYYYDVSAPAENKIKMDLNEIGCGVFNVETWECYHCRDGYYKSLNICCEEGKINFDGVCQNIVDINSLLTSDCQKAEPSEDFLSALCTQCDDSGTNRNLSRGHCCPDASPAFINGACDDLPNQCKELDLEQGNCSKCNDDFYFTEEFYNCCADDQYSNGLTSCTVIKGAVGMENCSQYDRVFDICLKCSDNYTFDGSNCILTSELYDHCLRIDPVSKNCIKCESTHFLESNICCQIGTEFVDFSFGNGKCTTAGTPVDDCKEHDSTTTCRECNDQYYLASTTKCCNQNTFWNSTSCISIQTLIVNCAYFNYTLKKCLTCVAGDDRNYYIKTLGTICCPEGQYENISGECENIVTATQCAQATTDADADCSKCNEGFISINSVCEEYMANCVNPYENTNSPKKQYCQECEFGYIFSVVSYTCVLITDAQILKGLYGALTTNVDENDHDGCRDYFSGEKDSSNHSYCCPGGQVLLSDSNNFTQYCVLHDANPNCQSTQDSSCDFCYLHKEWCTNKSIEKYHITHGYFGISTEIFFNFSDVKTEDNFYINYHKNSGEICCENGNYEVDGKCIENPIENCSIYDSITFCTVCKNEYILSQGKCCKYDEIYDYYYEKCIQHDSIIDCPNHISTTVQYKSNGHCCKETNYWNEKENRCIPLYDDNCKRSDNTTTCSNCDSKTQLDTIYKALLTLDLEGEEPCINPEIKFEFERCVPDVQIKSVGNKIVPYPKLTYITDNCLIFDFDNEICTKCTSDAYKTENHTNCCLNDKTGFVFNEIIQCIEIPKLMDHCSNYDQENRICLECTDSHHLSGGRCCPKDFFLNRTTLECTIQDQYCKTFNVISSNCTECIEDSYISHHHCCLQGKFWDKSTKKCENLTTSGFSECLRLGDDGTCKQCVADSASGVYYLHHGRCCKEGLFWNWTEKDCKIIKEDTNLAGSPLEECLRFDMMNLCTKCGGKDIYKSYNRCCDETKYYNGTTCVSIASPLTNCLTVNANDHTVCTSCDNTSVTHYITNGHCCLLEEYWDTIATACVGRKYVSHCLISEYNGTSNVNNCTMCESGYSLIETAANMYSCLINSALTGGTVLNCNYYNPGFFCRDCSNGYDLNFTSNTCVKRNIDNCSQETFIDPDDSDCVQCDSGFILVSGRCIAAVYQYSHCISIAGGNCDGCEDGYYLENSDNSCVEILDNSATELQNCLTGFNSGGYTCTKCMSGYWDNSGTCAAVTKPLIPSCDLYGTATTCSKCVSGYYLIPGGVSCCKNGEIWHNTKNICIDNNKFTNTNCNKYNVNVDDYSSDIISVSCTGCKSGYNKVYGDGCCADNNDIWEDGKCTSTTDNGLVKCEKRSSKYTCERLNPTDLSDLDSSCDGDYYYTNEHCCAFGNYWNINLENCVSTATINLDCKKLGDDGECIDCDNSKYVSNGKCCVLNSYFNGEECTATLPVNYSNCSKINNNICEGCINGILTGNCCNDAGKYYHFDETSNTCKENAVGCEVYDFETKECTNCLAGVTGTTYFTPKACCTTGKYYDESANLCKLISSLSELTNSNCMKLYDDMVDKRICGGCTGTEVVRQFKCCEPNKINVNNFCVNSSVIDNCVRMKDNGLCSVCKSNFHLSKEVCCPTGEYFDDSDGSCKVKATLIDNCKEYIKEGSAVKCEICNSEHHVTNSGDNCCEIGKFWNGAACSAVHVTHCDNFENISPNKCNNCKTGYNIYNFTNDSDKGICCPDGQFHLLNAIEYDECLPISVMNKNCDIFDYKKMKCADTIDPVNPIACSSSHYFSDHYCCPINEKRDSTNITGCISFTGNLNCEGYSKTNDVCSYCKSGYYLTNDGCCVEDSHWNGSICVPNETNCKREDNSKCILCDITVSHLYSGHCCVFGKYWDGSKCKDGEGPLVNCKIFDDQQNNPTCIECNSDKLLGEDKKSCCAEFEFINKVGNDKVCAGEFDFPDNYLSYDIKLIEFYKCDISDSYLTNGICCVLGLYFNKTSRKCEIITQNPSVCNKYDDDTNKCLGCVSTHQFNSYDNSCFELPENCKVYDFQTNMCSQCGNLTLTVFYLSSGKCCPVTQQNVNGTCTNISITTDCNKVKDGICIECKENYYLVESTCCQNEYYMINVNSCGNDSDILIPECVEYNSFGHCRKCNTGFLLLNLKNGKKKCLSMAGNNTGIIENSYNIDDCKEYDLLDKISEEKNHLICTKCNNQGLKDGFFPKLLTSITNINLYLEVDVPSFCSENLDIKPLISSSTLECTICSTNDKYVKNGICVSRNNDDNCSSFLNNKDICTECADGFYLNEDNECESNPIDNCKLYDRKNDLCLLCDPAVSDLKLFYEYFEGRIISRCQDVSPSNTPGPIFYPGFIWECNEDTSATCETTAYSGLSGEISRLFSCHVCKDGNSIPVASYTGGRDYTWTVEGIQRANKDFQINEDLDKNTDSSNYLQASNCVDISNWSTFPDNCAFAIINSNKKFSNSDFKNDLSNVNTFCVACKPGYKPKRNNLLPLLITTCTQILNCSSSVKKVNSCDDCNANFIFGYNEKTGVDFSECVNWTTKSNEGFGNCYAADNTAANVDDYKCKYCERGYLLNADNKCEKFHPPFCSPDVNADNTTFNTMPFFSPHDLQTGIHMLKNGRGCSKCEATYTGLYQENDNWVCTESPYVSAGVFESDSVLYDTNCTNYGTKDGDVACVLCTDGFILTTKNKCVQKINNLLNCSVAISAGECSVCDATFVVVNKLCVEESIDNCMVYLQDPLETTIQCVECNEGHYLHNNECLVGEFENCRIFKEKSVCKQCKDNFALVVMEDEKEFCFPVTRHINCKEYSTDSFQNNVIECTKCDSNSYFLNPLSDPEYVCNPFTDIPNCIKYDNEIHIINSSYKCLECLSTHYLTNNQCVVRNVTINHCDIYDLLSQTCSTCDEGYYKNQSKTECVLNPIGIPGCNKYSDVKTCIQCDTNLYYQDNICKKVPEENLIEECEFYSNSETCTQCISPKMLENQLCVDTEAQNCDKFLNPYECSTCIADHGIKLVDGLRKCESLPIRLNCQSLNLTFPFDCTNCNTNFYLDSNKECQNSTKITNCLYYKTADTCSQCQNNHILNKEGTICTPYNVASNCNSFKQIDAFCVLCESGFELDVNQECVAVANAASDASCLIADSHDSSVCLMCAPGYWMNSEKICAAD